MSVQSPDELTLDTAMDSSDLLICISPPAHSYMNSTFANIARFRTRETAPFLQIHPVDAQPRGVADGDIVCVANELGKLQLTAQLVEGLIPGTVLAPGIWWTKFSKDGRNINQVTAQAQTDMGSGAVFYDTLVKIEKWQALE